MFVAFCVLVVVLLAVAVGFAYQIALQMVAVQRILVSQAKQLETMNENLGTIASNTDHRDFSDLD